MSRTAVRQFRWLFDIVFNPQNLIQTSSHYKGRSITGRLKIFVSVTLFFLLNVVLYALPLSLAEVGFVREQPAPPWFAEISLNFVNDADYAWMVLVRLVNNGQFLVIFGFLTYFLYHVGIWLTRESNGAILSYRIVMVNTSIYLAVIFNLAWLAVDNSQTEIAGSLIDWLFDKYFATIAEFMGVAPPFGPVAQPPSPENLTFIGKGILVGLVLSLCYYIYVLYFGAIKIHEMTRYEAALVIGFTATAPILFGTGSILIGQLFDIPPVFSL